MGNQPNPKFPIRRRQGEQPARAAAASPPARPAPPPAPSPAARPVPARRGSPAAPTVVRVNQPSSAAALPPHSPLPRATPEETREAERARRRRQDRRHAARTVEALSGREGEAVAILLEATGGKAWPWPRHVHKLVAKRLGISARAASDFLAAIRRTIGLPLLAGDRDGPLVKTPEWRRIAMETGDFGDLTPLRTPDALGDNGLTFEPPSSDS